MSLLLFVFFALLLIYHQLMNKRIEHFIWTFIIMITRHSSHFSFFFLFIIILFFVCHVPFICFSFLLYVPATEACMTIPELQQDNNMEADGKIVNVSDKSINCVKCAVDLVWNLPALANRLNMDETTMRKALSSSTQNTAVLDTKYKVKTNKQRG